MYESTRKVDENENKTLFDDHRDSNILLKRRIQTANQIMNSVLISKWYLNQIRLSIQQEMKIW